jgi:hypothetical protein
MRNASKICAWSSFVLTVFLIALPASAQATRTWVSGVGDDANPCSRTAPCKTFAGAISKTATNGEINVLDPGGFGGVTITKSITISSEGFEAGVLVSGTNAIVINAPSSAVIVLRGLDIEGLGTGLNGIRFLAGGALHVEDCTINNFSQKGISFEPSGASELFVRDTVVRNNQQVSGGGILVKPLLGGSAFVTLDHVQLLNNREGIRIEGGTVATASNSVSSGNTFHGFIATGTAVGAATLHLHSCVASENAGDGLRVNQNGSTISFAGTSVTGNDGTGLSLNGGVLVSFGNNFVNGNGVNGSPTTTVPPI